MQVMVMWLLVEVEGPPEVLELLLGLPLFLLLRGLPLPLAVSYPLQHLSMDTVVSYNTLACQ